VDIGTVRSEIQALQNTMQVVVSDGLSVSSAADAAIAAANKVIAQAISTANGYVDHANADVTAAYDVANGMATGACTGDGPAKTPCPLAHIN